MNKELIGGFLIAFLIYGIFSGLELGILIFFGIIGYSMYYLVKNKREGNFSLVSSKNNIFNLVDFKDIGGQKVAIGELKEALDFLKHQTKLADLDIRPLKGILLTGPPGTGKTLLAKAAASYTDSVFISASGSEFIEMYAGVGAKRIRKLFQSAKDLAQKKNKNHALIFIDEVEILGGKRGQVSSHLEYDQTLNQLLVEMDGLKMEDKISILLIGATNRVDILDEALLRPGRFDRQVKVDLPDRQGRKEILELYTKNKPLGEDVSIDEISKDTFGFSGASLESLANEAAILAFRENSSQISQHHFQDALDKVIMGEKLERRPSLVELKRISVHEVGHALLSEKARPKSVVLLTITPRGQALGYMRQSGRDDQYLYTKEEICNQIDVALAGALAEEFILGDISTGAMNDYKQAFDLAEQILKAGMSNLGIVNVDILPREIHFKAISEILAEEKTKTKQFLASYKENINAIVDILIKEEKISGDKFRKITKTKGF